MDSSPLVSDKSNVVDEEGAFALAFEFVFPSRTSCLACNIFVRLFDWKFKSIEVLLLLLLSEGDKPIPGKRVLRC